MTKRFYLEPQFYRSGVIPCTIMVNHYDYFGGGIGNPSKIARFLITHMFFKISTNFEKFPSTIHSNLTFEVELKGKKIPTAIHEHCCF